MKVENANWNPVKKSSRSATAKVVQSMKPGECLRITHEDIRCHVGSGSRDVTCNLSNIARSQRNLGWEIEFYHEAQYVAVIRRTK